MEPGGGHKHSDNHVVWIDPTNGDHLLVGTDAGLYETFDDGVSWRHVSNLPVSQFYRVAVDNSVPFTNVLGGAQDLGTLYGPTRTGHIDGVRNQDWSVTLGADGYHTAFDPEEPDISYLEWQVGNVMRHDRRTMELTDIQPQPAAGDPPERWNWDTPILISPHDRQRIYLASQRVWRSDDRGDSWTAVSGDLTTDPNRYAMTTTDRQVSVDSLYDHEAMSLYGSITAISESELVEGVLYVGTDDGLLHVTEDGGGSWRAAANPPDLPERSFINNVEASRHDPSSVFVVADDHKSGDYRPYLYESTDRGLTWRSISGDLPDGTIVWALEQDHINPDLLFIGAEHGIHVSLDHGVHWHKLTKDVPTISFRDLAIQRRDDDLIGASFGRGFYVLDDYSPLRELTEDRLSEPGTLFPIRDAWWYVPYQPMQGAGQPTLGSTAYRTENPAFGATFTYHLGQAVESAKATRRAGEKEADKAGHDVDFPGWDRLWDEHLEADPMVRILISDRDGKPIRSIGVEAEKGLHRATWDLRHPAPDPVDLSPPGFKAPWEGEPRGALVTPGTYRAELVVVTGGEVQLLSGPQQFDVVAVPGAGPDAADTDRFRLQAAELARRTAGAAEQLKAAKDRIRHLRAGVVETPAAVGMIARLEDIDRRVEVLNRTLNGDPVRQRLSEPTVPSIRELIGRSFEFHGSTTGPPTATQRNAVERAAAEFGPVAEELNVLVQVDLPALIADVDAAGGPFTPR